MSHSAHSSRFHQDLDPRDRRTSRDKKLEQGRKPGYQPRPVEDELKSAAREANKSEEILSLAVVGARLNQRSLLLQHDVLSRNRGKKDRERAIFKELKRIRELKELCLAGDVKPLPAALEFLRRIKKDNARREIVPAFLKDVVDELRHCAGHRHACEYMVKNARQLEQHATAITKEKDPEALLRLTDPELIQELLENVLAPPAPPEELTEPQVEPMAQPAASMEDFKYFMTEEPQQAAQAG